MKDRVSDPRTSSRDRDRGCEAAPSCLHCPFSECLEERFRGRPNHIKGIRNLKIRELATKGTPTLELMSMFGVSRRTILRVVRRR